MVRKTLIVLAVLFALMLVATAALAQEGPDAEPVEEVVGGAAVLALIHFLSQPLVKIVDRVKNWFNLGGWQITLTAVVLGSGVAWALNLDPFPAVASLIPDGFQLRQFPVVVGYIVAGGWMAFRAGYLNDNQEALKESVVVEVDEDGDVR